jgi:hypothetical protein
MEKGYEGPYDIILECECLDAACSDKQTFEKCIKVLHSLLKPGGTLVRVSANAITDMDNLVYSVGGKERTCIRLTHEYVARIMTENGFQDIEIAFSPLDPDTSGLFLLMDIISSVPENDSTSSNYILQLETSKKHQKLM